MKTWQKWTAGLAVSGALATGVGAMVIDFNRWAERCGLAGGTVVSEYVGTVLVPTYFYDSKGNITGVTFQPVDQYDYHCRDQYGRDMAVPE